MILASQYLEDDLWQKGFELVCGVDEVGRGCFAGPVVTAAVIFPQKSQLPFGIADSKLLSAKKREELAQKIKKAALSYCISEVSVERINEVGIVKSTQECFKKCVEGLANSPDFILVDAFYIVGINKNKQNALIHGDRICATIAAASILAKVYRDSLMESLDKQFPHYGFGKHKGYGTLAHRQAIQKHGLCSLHRTSFNLSKFL